LPFAGMTAMHCNSDRRLTIYGLSTYKKLVEDLVDVAQQKPRFCEQSTQASELETKLYFPQGKNSLISLDTHHPRHDSYR
jgi:hypothetical protein